MQRVTRTNRWQRWLEQLQQQGVWNWLHAKLRTCRFFLWDKPTRQIRNLGFGGWCAFASRRLIESYRAGRFAGRTFSLPLKHSQMRVRGRTGASDILAFSQVFAEGQYDFALPGDIAGLVLDVGANVGYASVFLLSRFPNIRVIAIEPDAENFQLLRENLAPFGSRAQCLNAAVWSTRCGLVPEQEFQGAGKEWARSFRPARPGEIAPLAGVPLEEVIAGSGCERVALLKVDIEGGEIALFRDGYQQWLARADRLAIELHGDECEAAFNRAISPEEFSIADHGEIKVCFRKALKTG